MLAVVAVYDTASCWKLESLQPGTDSQLQAAGGMEADWQNAMKFKQKRLLLLYCKVTEIFRLFFFIGLMAKKRIT